MERVDTWIDASQPNELHLDRTAAASVVIAAADHFASSVAEIDRRLRRAQLTIPPPAARAEVTAIFWAFIRAVETAAAPTGVPDETIRQCREIAGRWLFRSRLWSRAFLKPHGYPGDFRMIEWLYDLEVDECADPAQPAIVNCLDGLMKTVHSTVSVWERRRWFRDLLCKCQRRRDGALRVLDVAAGGARYLRDFLLAGNSGPHFELTVVDQDAAAIAFCREQVLAPWADRIGWLCTPIRDLPERLGACDFDLIISAGLFDYLDQPSAQELLAYLASLLTPDGTIAISNFHPGDPSRLVKEWLADWPLIYRDEAACARLLPSHLRVHTSLSTNGALVYATGTAAPATSS